MLPTRSWFQKAISWFMAALGIIIGFLMLVLVGEAYINKRHPSLWIAVTFCFCLAIVFLYTSLGALHNRRRSGFIFLGSALVAVPYLTYSNGLKSIGDVAWMVVFATPFCIFGLFWLGTYKFGWPPLLAARPRSLKRRIATVLIGCLVLAILDVVATFVATAWTASSVSLSCNDVLPFSQPKRPDHEVFIARLVRVGHTKRISGRWVGEWAVGHIEEEFWGLPWWTPRFVLLTDDIFWEGETYFIDGRRAPRLLPHLLPIVIAGPCGRTRPLVNAAVDVYLLRKSSSAGGARIVGCVQNGSLVPWYSAAPVARTPVSGARVSLTGSSGTKTTFTDHEGIYQFDGLTADDYDIVLKSPGTQISEKRKVGKNLLESHRLLEIDFAVSASDTTGSK